MSNLTAGAAKVCITPPEEMMPAYSQFSQVLYEGIYQDIYVRSLVLDNGSRKFAMITIDSGDMSRTSDIRVRLTKAFGLSPENIFFAVTHTHEAPTFANEHEDVENDPKKLNWALRYGDFVIEKTKECVGLAMQSMRPARYGFGKGKSYINVCRDQLFENGVWGQGRDFEGPSDKTLAILKFIDDENRLIAGVLNYAVHGTACFLKKDEKDEKYLISGDVPGMVSEYLEERYKNDDSVFLWTSGAAGNQNPIFFTKYQKFNHDHTNAMYYDAGYAAWGLCEHMAQTQGVDAIRILDSITRMKDCVNITVVDRTITLPGQVIKNVQVGSAGRVPFSGTIEDGEPVNLQLKLITLDDIAFLGLNGELVTEIGLRLKEKSPLKNTFIITHTAERVGYLPDKRGYDNRTFAFYASLVKDGCTEEFLTRAMLDMFNEKCQQYVAGRPLSTH